MNSASSRLAPVIQKTWLTYDIVSVWVRAGSLARSIKPGQFLGVKPGPGPDPLLRRPISVADVHRDKVRLVFRLRGRGTEMLARVQLGDCLDVLGPLGKPAPALSGRRVIVCGGGVGAAPLLYYVRRLRNRRGARVFLGARGKSQLILVQEFRNLGVPVKVATDDGSEGHHGMVTELVENKLRTQNSELRSQKSGRPSAVIACGPKPMLAELVRRLDPAPVWGFVEERMGCGTGICYCCALPKKGGGYFRFCQEGPVVLLNEVEL